MVFVLSIVAVGSTSARKRMTNHRIFAVGDEMCRRDRSPKVDGDQRISVICPRNVRVLENVRHTISSLAGLEGHGLGQLDEQA